MPPRKKTAVKKRKTTAKKVTKRAKQRETPLQKLAFRISILEEGFDALEEDLRELRGACTKANAENEVIVERDVIDVAPEHENAIDEHSPAHNE
jgi:hypothetical protein